MDHIFPQADFRPLHGNLVDDIGNAAFLGKLRNIRKGKSSPMEHFENTPDNVLRDDYLIEDRALLAPERFVDFVAARRQLLLATVKSFLGR